jgi:uncharacterized membrane protein YbhN (UPF0104 family)
VTDDIPESTTAPIGADDTGIPERPKRPWWKQAISIAITLVVLVAVFGFVIPQLADYDKVLEYIGEITTQEWAVLAALAGWFLMAYPIVLAQILRSARLRETFANHMTGTAITNSVPSGGALALPLNYAMYLSWGFTPESISATLLGAGVWDWLARISLPVIAVIGVAIVGDVIWWMWLVTVVGVAIVAVMVFTLVKVVGSESAAERLASFVDRTASRVLGRLNKENPGVHNMVMQFRLDLKGIVSDRAWRLTWSTISNHAAMAALFTASVYAVGISTDQIAVPWVVLAFTLGRFLVMIPVSPGGLGLVDLGWIGILTLGWQMTSGEPVDTDRIAAGVLLFRGLSLLPPIPIGMASWLFWRANKSWRHDWRSDRRGETIVAE